MEPPGNQEATHLRTPILTPMLALMLASTEIILTLVVS